MTIGWPKGRNGRAGHASISMRLYQSFSANGPRRSGRPGTGLVHLARPEPRRGGPRRPPRSPRPGAGCRIAAGAGRRPADGGQLGRLARTDFQSLRRWRRKEHRMMTITSRAPIRRSGSAQAILPASMADSNAGMKWMWPPQDRPGNMDEPGPVTGLPRRLDLGCERGGGAARETRVGHEKDVEFVASLRRHPRPPQRPVPLPCACNGWN